MPVFKTIATIRNLPKHPKQISRLQSRPKHSSECAEGSLDGFKADL
ncbi:MAG: hypothetical protein IK014_06195 [Lachnospiraceae bacterium]|nr:hypothetical protein [Lachnospiraceae bacterium]